MSYDTAAADPDISQTGNETQLDSSRQPHSQVSPAPVIDHLQYVQKQTDQKPYRGGSDLGNGLGMSVSSASETY